ncbi:hypothetical protein ACEWY4_024612 [Coilia grayii]|uniref:C2H2-type domain-containing protein n=1 Tax=Coilia grayii TaxID=363190 RepID=A0ABD1IV72_9TELE
MPPVAKRARREDLSLELSCEWGACQETFCDMQEFCRHVEEHLHHNVLTGFDTTEDVDFVCLWRDCGSISGSEELLRHAFFHCHHTKLKQWGLAILKTQANLGTCVVGQHNRNIVPPTTDRFTCLWENCGVSMDNVEWYYRHVDNHAQSLNISPMEKQEKVFRCGWTDCNLTFKGRQFKLREHLRSHTQERIVACPSCGAMFANNTKLFDHIRRQTTADDPKLQCPHCLRCFPFERLLRDHMRKHVGSHKCTLCVMTFPTPSAVKNHMRFRHSTERPYSCDMCQYSCKNKIDLQKHVDTHNQEPVYECDYEDCNFAARVMESLQGHIRKAHLKDPAPCYLCHICEQSFNRGHKLTIHLCKKHQWKSHSRVRYIKHADGFMRLLVSRPEAAGLASLSGEGCDADQPAQGECTDPGYENETCGHPSSSWGPNGAKSKLAAGEGGNAYPLTQDEDSQPGCEDRTPGRQSSARDPNGANSESGPAVDQPADSTMQEYLEEVCRALMEESSVDKLASGEDDVFGQLSIVVPSSQCGESVDQF